MKKLLLALGTIAMFTTVKAQICNGEQAFISVSYPHVCNSDPYILYFEDNFDGNSLDLTKWNYVNGVTRDPLHEHEQQWYSPNNIEVSNGTLKLIAKNEDLPNKCFQIWYNGGMHTFCQDFIYSSAEINSKSKFGYGKYEIRCKIPKGKGFWPAFWMFGGPSQNENDVFEFWNKYSNSNFDLNKSVSTYNFNSHFDFDYLGTTYDCHSEGSGSDYSNDFHTFTFIWNNYKMEWYIDGVLKRASYKFYTLLGQSVDCNSIISEVYMLNKAFPQSQFQNIIANLAIKSKNESPDNNTPFPSFFEIDYIRYYKQMPYGSTGTENIEEESNAVKVYPNPTLDRINIVINGNNNLNGYDIQLYDLQGRNILSKTINDMQEVSLNVTGFEQGTYLLIVKDNEGHFIHHEQIMIR